MTSFSWKRKANSKVSASTASAFKDDTDDDDAIETCEVDWLTLAKKPKLFILEDGFAKAKRLQEEGSVLALADRYWEAIKKWEEALTYTPNDETLHEMRAQAFMHLNEVFPAIEAAEKAVSLKPNWWPAQQTLGRARMGLGEIKMAIKSFSRAILLNPQEKDLWEEDLHWALSLVDGPPPSQTECETDESEDRLTKGNSEQTDLRSHVYMRRL